MALVQILAAIVAFALAPENTVPPAVVVYGVLALALTIASNVAQSYGAEPKDEYDA